MEITKLTIQQAIIITGYTGITCCDFSPFHADVETRMGRPVRTHEFGSEEFAGKIKELYRADFLSIIPERTDGNN